MLPRTHRLLVGIKILAVIVVCGLYAAQFDSLAAAGQAIAVTLGCAAVGIVTSKELREKRAPLAVKIRELADKANDSTFEWNAEAEAEWKRVNDEYNAYTRQIELIDRAETVEHDQQSRRDELADRQLPGREDLTGRNGRSAEGHRRDAGATGGDEQRATALLAWCRYQLGEELTREQRQACRRSGVNPSQRVLRMNLAPTVDFREMQGEYQDLNHRIARGHLLRRDLAVGVGASGGFTAPCDFVRQLEVNMLAFGGILQVADLIRTDNGNELPWPTMDDTSNEGEIVGESASIGSSVDPTFAAVVLRAYKFSSKLIKAPTELLEDSAFNLAVYLGAALGERLGRAQNRKCTTGTAASEPNGIVTAATLGVTAGSATAIAADELIDLEHSVDPAYRNERCRYMLHDNVLLHIRKLKDGNGAYLFQSNLRQGAPDTLNGRQFVVNQHMASSVATTNKTVLFGDMSKYKVRQVRQIRMKRLVERYADYDQDGFIAFLRADGNLLDAGSHPVKYLQQP